MEKIVEIKDLGYSYSNQGKILKNVNLEIFSNEVFVLLGHNGAGKTTLIRLILDFLRDYNGEIKLFGESPESVISRKKIGFMSEQPVIYDYETAEGYLGYFARLAEIEHASERIKELMDLAGLSLHKDKKLSQYSKGMLQRLNLIRALLNDPDLLIMDEPIIGLDPLGQDLIEKVVKDRHSKGKSVFINTHAVSFAARVADRVGFLMGGELKRIFTRDEFEKGTFPFVYEIECSDKDSLEKIREQFSTEEHAVGIYRVIIKDKEKSDALLGLLVNSPARILHVGANQEVLEKAFIDYSKDLTMEDRAR
jgi:ABC-2 type transport system ATP-binding protein